MIRITSQYLIFIWFSIYFYYIQCGEIFNHESWVPVASNIAPWVSISSTEYNNHTIHSSTWKSESTEIFIGISSYRDRRCALTIKNLLSKAKYPNRLVFGIVQQRHTEDDRMDCIKDYCELMALDKDAACVHKHQLQTIAISNLEGKGPSSMHYMQQSMIHDEEFCMQVDSHTDAIQNWDTLLMDMWGSINNEFAILSTRLPDITQLPKKSTEVPHVCHFGLSENGMIRALQPRKARNLEKPILAPMWIAGFTFSKCHSEKKVPYDPLLPFIYDGEEFSRFARYWTHGYDIYTPNKNTLGHDYTNKMSALIPETIGQTLATGRVYVPDQKEWKKHGMTSEFRRQEFDDSIERIKLLLKGASLVNAKDDIEAASILGTLTKYGLGAKRTLDQLIEFVGIDLRSDTIYGDRCKSLDWVPFKADLGKLFNDY